MLLNVSYLIIIKLVSITDIVNSMTEHTGVRIIERDITAEADEVYKRENR